MIVKVIDNDNYECTIGDKPFIVNRFKHKEVFIAIIIAFWIA